jgi:hypothetical protein
MPDRCRLMEDRYEVVEPRGIVLTVLQRLVLDNRLVRIRSRTAPGVHQRLRQRDTANPCALTRCPQGPAYRRDAENGFG